MLLICGRFLVVDSQSKTPDMAQARHARASLLFFPFPNCLSPIASAKGAVAREKGAG